MAETALWRRHTLVWIKQEVWAGICAEHPDTYPADWVAAGRPLVVRRRLPGDPLGAVPLGLPLPPSQGKRRLGVVVDKIAVTSIRAMPRLDEAAARAPDGWRPVIDQILDVAPQAKVFGSLAWAFLTSLPYLTPTSDLDLLLALPQTMPAQRRLAVQLHMLDQTSAVNLDGEYVRGDGLAAKWREMLHSTDDILVKDFDSVRLMPRMQFCSDA